MTDEDRLIELLRRHQAGDQGVAGDILELVDTYFSRSLRPVVVKTFGTKVVGMPSDYRQKREANTASSQALVAQPQRREQDGQCRYTEMVNDFFVKVLDKKPDAIWKAQTAKDLRTWASVVIANQMRDFLRRKQRGQQILAEIAPLVEQKQRYFEDRYRTTFEEFLDQLARWEAGADSQERLLARVLRHRYVDGMTWGNIAADLAISDERLNQIRVNAEQILRKKFS